jgi:hypothetical protein
MLPRLHSAGPGRLGSAQEQSLWPNEEVASWCNPLQFHRVGWMVDGVTCTSWSAAWPVSKTARLH